METGTPPVVEPRGPSVRGALRFWAVALPLLAVAWWARSILSDAIQSGIDQLPQDRFRGRIGAGSAFWVVVGRGVQVGTLVLLVAATLTAFLRPFRRTPARSHGG